ncbi:MAG: PorT family protein [Proteobacteria bacterium]|nr:PorT family protein [Pseudomonadota bacterium]
MLWLLLTNLLLSLLYTGPGNAAPVAEGHPLLRWLSWCPYSQLLGKYGVNRVSIVGADTNDPNVAVVFGPQWRAFGAAGISFSCTPMDDSPFTKRIVVQAEMLLLNRGAELFIDGLRVGKNNYWYVESPLLVGVDLLPRKWPIRLYPVAGFGVNMRLAARVTDRNGDTADIQGTNLFDLGVLAGVVTEVAVDQWVLSSEIRYERGLMPLGDAQDFDDLHHATWSILIGVGYRFSTPGRIADRSSTADAPQPRE